MQSDKMLIRKIQKTGGSSYIITLPKTWLESFIEIPEKGENGDYKKLKKEDVVDPIKGSELGLIVQSDNSLLVTPHIHGRKYQRTKKINLEDINDPNYLFRYLISVYIAGFTEIEIRGTKEIDTTLRSAIRRFIQTVRYQEIIDEQEDVIHIKDLLNPEEMPFPKIINRMFVTAKNMHKDAIYALKTKDKELLVNIGTRDNDVDRLYWLVTRLTNMLMRDVSLSEKIGIQPESAANMFLIGRIIERIADHAVRLSENVNELVEHHIDEVIINKIEEAVNIGLIVFQNSIDAFFKHDILKANENIDTIGGIYKLSQEIMDYAFNEEKSLEVAIPLDNIVESIRRLGEYSRDISENVMNHILLV